jgi:GTPase
MIDIEPPRERALLVGAPPKGLPQSVADEHLEELGHLTDTAGADVLGTLSQRLDSPHPKFYLGQGKANELGEEVRAKGATLIVFDEELSPAQGKNLEELTGTRVMDRAELILDIFATRARTAEAKLQVELAQLQYLLPRLTRMWAHLSRVRGGIGMRGPGETQLETDRRMIRQKIDRLKDDLARVERQRATQRRSREDVFQAALVGYTNAGKSSVLRNLSGSDVFVEDRLFATLDATTRSVDLDEGFTALVTDTVGFIRKLPHHLVASFRATLEESAEADLLLHVIDVSHPSWEEQKQVVDEVLTDLGVRDRPTLLVFNKVDRLTHAEEESFRQRVRGFFDEDSVFVSTVVDGALEPLRDALRDRVRDRLSEVRIDLPASQGAMLAEIYREGEVLEREDDGATIHLRVRLPGPALGRLRQRGVLALDRG